MGADARGVGHHVVMRPIPDLFVQTGDKLVCDDGRVLGGIQVFCENSVTSIPDNIGCVEVTGVGADVHNVAIGDVVFLDFFDVDQGFQIANSDHFIALDHVFRAKFHHDSGTVEPLAGYALTKRATERMRIALTGTDRVDVPEYILTEGIPSGWDSDGMPLLHTVYEEVVSVGPPPYESPRRHMTKAERALLDSLADDSDGLNQELWDDFRAERSAPRAIDVEPGDLVPFCTEFRTKLRVRGQFLSLVSQLQIMGVIDDGMILDRAIRSGTAGKLVI